MGKELDPMIQKERHLLIKKVTERMESFRLNTIVSSFMEFMNVVAHPDHEKKAIDQKTLQDFLILLSPLAPHMAEELWVGVLGEHFSVHKASWRSRPPYWESTRKRP